MNEFELRVWRLHPQGVRIIPAERTLQGEAHPDALRWCGPFKSANQYGFWVFPSLDLDFVWRGSNRFEYRVYSPWLAEEVPLIRSLVREDDTPEATSFAASFGGRTKVEFGRVAGNICQIWTGCIFQTSPGWALLIRSPINLNMDAPYRIQEGILETDWMRYDIWINVAVQEIDMVVSLRRDQWPPLAQLVPIQHASYAPHWMVREELLNRESPEADRVYREWSNYNYKKYIRNVAEKPKDPGTYFKERKSHLSRRRLDPQPTSQTTPRTAGRPIVIPELNEAPKPT